MIFNLQAVNTISLINSLKTAFACGLGLVCAYLLEVPTPQWTIVTILVVMASQNRVGAAMRTGATRFVATVVGALVAALILFLFTVHTHWLYIFLIFFIFLFTYMAGVAKDYQDAYILGSITLTMILVASTPTVRLAYDRFIEIMLGIVIALLVTRFIYPIHSKSIIKKNLATILRQIAELYSETISKKKDFYSISYKRLEETIIQSLTLQPILLREAMIESRKVTKKKIHLVSIHRLERRLMRCIYMMHEALKTPKGPLKNITKGELFTLLNQDIIENIKNIADKLENKKIELIKTDLSIHLRRMIDILKTDAGYLNFDEQTKIGAYVFCVQYLHRILSRLSYLVQKIS